MLKKFFDLFRKNSLVSGSLVVLVGATVSNLGSYLFHLAMGRLLGPSDYGILASLISLSYFLGIPVSVLTLVVVKFVSQNSKNKEKVALFIKKISRKVSPFCFLGLALFLLFFPFLRKLVKVDNFFLFLGLGIGNFLSVYIAFFSATLQGIMKFLELVLLNIAGSWLRLFVAVLAGLLGMKVGGVIYATVFSTLLCLILGYRLLKKHLPLDLRGEIGIKSSFTNIKSYSLSVLLSNLSLTSFFTMDIILARYFLSPIEAGQYASLSVLGKIIYFASSPIASVMFPMISEKQANGGNFHKLLWESVLIVVLISFFVGVVYFLFPQQMILVLFGKKYLEAAKYLGFFAVFVSIYSLCSLLMNFYLSISRTKIIYLGVIFAVLQVILINFYHQGIRQIVFVNILILFLFLVCLLVYYTKIFLLYERVKRSD